MIYGFANFALFVVFFYHYFWGSMNDFVQFLDCSIVNKTYMMQKYSKIVDIKKDIKIFLILTSVYFFLCFLYGGCSFKERDNVKIYHSEIEIELHEENVEKYDDNSDKEYFDNGIIRVRKSVLGIQ